MSCHVIYHIIYHDLSCRVISYPLWYMIWYDIILYHFLYMISYRIISYIILHRISAFPVVIFIPSCVSCLGWLCHHILSIASYIDKCIYLCVCVQQHSLSTHERLFLWKCRSFRYRKFLDLRGTRTPTFGFMSNALITWAIGARHLLYHVFEYWLWWYRYF